MPEQVFESDGCDHCGRVRELYHNDATGLSLCESCDQRATEAAYSEEAGPGLDIPVDTRGTPWTPARAWPR